LDTVGQANRFADLRAQAIAAGEAGDAEGAREFLEQLAELSNSSDSAILAVELFNEAVGLANEGKFQEAIVLFEQVAQMQSREDLATSAAASVEELRGIVAREQNVELYNKAVAALNGGDFDKAASLVEELLAAEPRDDLKTNAERMLRDISRNLGKRR
jgi:tetratricopeptide (TPR) repeat protein